MHRMCGICIDIIFGKELILFLAVAVDSWERKCVAKETLVNAEKGLVDGSEKEKVQTPKMEVSGLNRKPRDVGSKCGDATTLSKRKRDLCTDLHAYPGRETSNEFETCVACSKRQRYLLCMHTLLSFLCLSDFTFLDCQTKF